MHMAEFCKECFKSKVAVSSDNITDDMLVMSEGFGICEGCGEYKQIVVGVEDNPIDRAFKKTTKYLSENNPRIIDVLEEIGISLYNEDGSFRTVFEILSEIRDKYVNRGDVDAESVNSED